MVEVYISKTGRTPMGKSKNGIFRNTDALQLSAKVMEHLGDDDLDEIIWGAVQQYGPQGYNVGRNAALVAGLNDRIPAQTINRLCGSSMTAAHVAYSYIKSGMGNKYLVGGVEHMGHNPMTEHFYDSPHLSTKVAKGSASMGLTAEMVAKIHGITREEQDLFAFNSHAKASTGMHLDGIIPTMGHDANGMLKLITTDEPIRGETTVNGLAKLRPVFDPRNGTVTAGNSSAISDGASGMIVTGDSTDAIAKITAVATTAGEPATMGYQAKYAIELAMKNAGWTQDDVDVFEINEAFAGQSLAVMKDLEVSPSKVNVWGGAIAIGHPLGCSGTRIIGTLVNIMKDYGYKRGVAGMCVGFGQGTSIALEMI